MRHAAILLGTMALAGCADDPAPPEAKTARTPEPATRADPQPELAAPQGEGSTLVVQTAPAGALRLDPQRLTASPGEATLTFSNAGDQLHGLTITRRGRAIIEIEPVPGGVAAQQLRLRRGRYIYFCPVGDHRHRGMRGTLTVG